MLKLNCLIMLDAVEVWLVSGRLGTILSRITTACADTSEKVAALVLSSHFSRRL